MYFLLTEEDEFRLDLRKLKLNPDYMISVMKIGFPAGLQGVVFSLSNVVIQTAVNSFGSDCIPFFRTPQMLLLVYPITWILTGIVMNTAYFRVRKTVFARMAR